MRKLKIFLAVVASVAVIVAGQRHQVNQKDERAEKPDVQGIDTEKDALFI